LNLTGTVNSNFSPGRLVRRPRERLGAAQRGSSLPMERRMARAHTNPIRSRQLAACSAEIGFVLPKSAQPGGGGDPRIACFRGNWLCSTKIPAASRRSPRRPKGCVGARGANARPSTSGLESTACCCRCERGAVPNRGCCRRPRSLTQSPFARSPCSRSAGRLRPGSRRPPRRFRARAARADLPPAARPRAALPAIARRPRASPAP
jgi:hypothetical protein